MKQGQLIDLVAFGERGLWSDAEQAVLGPAYCTIATNLQLDTAGSLTVRDGWSDQTPTPVAGKTMETLHEYRRADETTEVIVAWDGGIANGISDPSGSDISGSVTDADGNWFFQNFNDKCIGFQSGQKCIVYTGSGNFATVVESGGTAPTGGVGCAAYGRIWQVDSTGSTIQYCGLLDETDWNSSSAGSINMNNIWTDGQDTITAIRGFNGALVVWGKRHVVFFADATGGSALGLDPSSIYVQDVIAGAGCVDQHSVQLVGEKDILFLSFRGVQSLGRLIQERSNPLDTVSDKVSGQMIQSIQTVTQNGTNVRSAYDVGAGRYLLSFPANAEVWALEVRRPYPDEVDGSLRLPVFKWNFTSYDYCYRQNGDLLTGQSTVVGKVTTNADDGTAITWEYASGWLDLGEQLANRKKLLKRVGMIVKTAWGGDLLIRHAVDFGSWSGSKTHTLTDRSGGAEWGIGKWGVDEWSGSVPLQQFKKQTRNTGQYYRFALGASSDKELTMPQLELFFKLGRLA